MELVRSWLTGIVAAAVVAALADSLIPEGAVKKLGRLTGGLLLLLAVLSPIGALDSRDLTEILLDYRIQSQSYSAALETENAQLIKTIIEQETAAYIQDKAAELGIQCRAAVTCTESEDGIACPERVVISGTLTQGQIEQLEHLIEQELAIPADDQIYEGET